MTEPAPAAEGQVADATPEAQGQANTGENTSAWYDNAPDEVKGYIQNKGWDDPLKAVEGYQNLEKFHGVDPDRLLKLPKEGEDMSSVYDRLGRPESADGYTWEAPEGVQVDDNRMTAFKQKAHELGLNTKQFEELAALDSQYSNEVMAQHREQIEQEQTKQLNQLKADWGDKFDERAEIGRRFVSANMPEGLDKQETLTAIEEAIGTANMLKLFANAGQRANLKDDSLPDSGGDRPYGYTREQAMADKKALMSELQGDRGRLEGYNTGKGPDFDKMKRLNEIIAG